jgi:hypothetical protein
MSQAEGEFHLTYLRNLLLVSERNIRKGTRKPRYEDVRGSGGITPPFLTSALDGSEWSASCPGRSIPETRALDIH